MSGNSERIGIAIKIDCRGNREPSKLVCYQCGALSYCERKWKQPYVVMCEYCLRPTDGREIYCNKCGFRR